MTVASQKTRIKPLALRPGDKVGIVAPASNIKREAFEAGCKGLRRLGYEPVFSDAIFDRDLYFAGSIERRVRELEEMFERDDIRAIICARWIRVELPAARHSFQCPRSEDNYLAPENLRWL